MGAQGHSRRGFTLLETLVVISVIVVLYAIGFPIYRYVRRNADVSSTATLIQSVASAADDYMSHQMRLFSWTDGSGLHQAQLFDLNGPQVVTGNAADCLINAHNPVLGYKYDSLDGLPADSNVTTDDSSPPFGPGPGYPSNGGSGPLTPAGINEEPKIDRDGVRDSAGQLYSKSAFPFAAVEAGYYGFYDMVQSTFPSRNISRNHQIVDAWNQPLRIAYAAYTYGARTFGIWSSGPDTTDDTQDDIKSWDDGSQTY